MYSFLMSVILGCSNYTVHFFRADAVKGMVQKWLLPGLYFHHDKQTTFPGDNIDLPGPASVVAFQDPIKSSSQITHGQAFPPIAESMSGW